ncbi:pilin N-terminal domain-containing protein [Lacticaseibacillus sp. GG6-2]
MLKRLLLALALAIFAVPAFFTANQTHAAENTTITLHKRIYRDARLAQVDEWQYDNQGQEVTLGDESFGLNGVNFEIYDATTLYDQAKESDETRAEFTQRLAKMSHKAALAMATKYQLQLTGKVKTQTVGTEDGVGQLQVPTRHDGDYAAYLIVEVSVDPQAELNVDLTKKASPILINLPVSVNDQQLDQLHIYPKNVGYVRDPFFFKYGVQLDGKQVRLPGAVFALYRLDEAGNKLYLDMAPVTDLKNSWVQSATPLTDPKVNLFTSDKDGLVNTGERFLPSGTYYFEELKAPDGYQKLDKPVKVEVPETWYDEDGNFLPVLINGEAMDETQSGVVQPATIAKGKPRVYNYQQPKLPDTDSTKPGTTATTPSPGSQTPSTPGSTPTSLLPNMGSAFTWLGVAVGLALILLAWLLWHKRQAHH